MTKHLKIILEEMCKRVGAEFSVVNSQDDWYMLYQWTKKQQENYENWLTNYLLNSKEARKELLTIPYKNKKVVEGVARHFVDNYGWKINEMQKV